jgi:[acyl-carrier-protein] S-malonyltransferase
MKRALLFPGQGAQYIGMGKDLAERYPQAAELFARANEIAGYDLCKLCFEGPEEKLNSTVISQPAIFMVSAALLELVRKLAPSVTADVTAGLSMGEYTALYAAGVMSFERRFAWCKNAVRPCRRPQIRLKDRWSASSDWTK